MTDYGDPTDWDEIPHDFAVALQTALTERDRTVLAIEDTFLTIDAPHLGPGEEWCLVKPNHRGWWAYGVYTNGQCANPTWLYVDPADPTALAVAVDELLRARGQAAE